MGERLRATGAQYPGRTLAVLAAVAVLGAALAAEWSDRLALSTVESKGAPLKIHLEGSMPARSATFRVAVRTMRSQLNANPVVASVGESRPPEGANSTWLMVAFEVGGRRQDDAIARVERDLDPGPLAIDFRGPARAAREAKDTALGDLVLLLLALPVVGLVAAATLGLRSGGAALLGGAAAAALASLVCVLAAGAFDVSWLALVGGAAAGVLVSLQLCAMARFGAPPRILWGSALAAAAAFAATAALGVGYLAAFGVGGALGSLLAAPASLAAMAAATTLEHARGAASAPWRSLAGLIAWSGEMAAAIAALVVLLLLIVAAPADRLGTAAIGAPAAPAIEAARLGAAVGAAGLITAALGFRLCRRPGMALAATAAAALPALATAGLLVVSFQDGELEGALGYTSNGAVQLGSLVAAVTVVAALCAAQAVALVSTSPRGAGSAQQVSEAMARCGPAVALACLAGVAAGIALGAGSASFVKEFGLGTAAGLTLELLIAQGLLAPALLRVMPGSPRHQ